MAVGVGWGAYAEGEVGEALGQAGQRLVSRASLCDQSQRRRGAGKVPAGELDALGLAGLVLEGARGRGREPALLRRRELAGSSLRAPAGGCAGQHRGESTDRGAVELGVEGNGWW